MSNKLSLKDYLITIDLETKLKIANEMAFIQLLTELGYRKDKMWRKEENELLTRICNYSNNHTKYILEIIENWKNSRSDRL